MGVRMRLYLHSNLTLFQRVLSDASMESVKSLPERSMVHGLQRLSQHKAILKNCFNFRLPNASCRNPIHERLPDSRGPDERGRRR